MLGEQRELSFDGEERSCNQRVPASVYYGYAMSVPDTTTCSAHREISQLHGLPSPLVLLASHVVSQWLTGTSD